MIELNEDNLQEHISGRAVVQYGAGWCGNCRLVKPKFKKLAETREDVKFIYVDAEKFPGARGFAKVDNLPTFAVFKDGQLIDQAQGNKIDVVEELLTKLEN